MSISLERMKLYRQRRVEARVLHFRQNLSSNLHFRQCKLPNSEFGEELISENARILMNFRQGIASSRARKSVKCQVVVTFATRAFAA